MFGADCGAARTVLVTGAAGVMAKFSGVKRGTVVVVFFFIIWFLRLLFLRSGRNGDSLAACGQLSTGGKDIAAARLAHERGHAFCFENRFEHFNPLRRRSTIRQGLSSVMWNQVYLCFQIMTIQKIC